VWREFVFELPLLGRIVGLQGYWVVWSPLVLSAVCDPPLLGFPKASGMVSALKFIVHMLDVVIEGGIEH